MATVAVTSRLTDHENIEISFAYRLQWPRQRSLK